MDNLSSLENQVVFQYVFYIAVIVMLLIIIIQLSDLKNK